MTFMNILLFRSHIFLPLDSRIVKQLVLANPGPVVIDKLHAANFMNLIGENKIFLTVADAVAACSHKLVEEA